jgi:HK97 family phage prohead protease
LWQHKQDEPIGVFEQMFEDEMGLYVQGRLLLDVARAREAYALLKQGAISGLSIGYSPTQYKIDANNGTRILSEIELWEISLVTFPANAAAGVTVVKQAFEDTDDFDAGMIRSGELIKLQDALDRVVGVLTL